MFIPICRKVNITLLIASIVNCGLPQGAYANGYQDKANEYIKATHDIAKAKADGIFQQILMAVLSQAQSGSAIDFLNIDQSISYMTKDLSATLEGIKRVDRALSSGEIKKLSEKVSAYAKSYFEFAIVMNQMDSKLSLMNMTLSDAQEQTIKMARLIEATLHEYCTMGVAAPVFSSFMPNIPNYKNNYSVGFSIPVYGEPVEGVSGSELLSGDGSAESNAKQAIGLNAAIILGEYLNTGNLVLSSGAGTISAAGAAIGLGIFVAVAITIAVIEESKVRTEARRKESANYSMFTNKATSETVRKFFLESCRQVEPIFDNIENQFLSAYSGKPTAQWLAEEKEVKEFLGEYIALTRAQVDEVKSATTNFLNAKTEKSSEYVHPGLTSKNLELEIYELGREINKAQFFNAPQPQIEELVVKRDDLKKQLSLAEKDQKELNEELEQLETIKKVGEFRNKIGMATYSKMIKMALYNDYKYLKENLPGLKQRIADYRGKIDVEKINHKIEEYSALAHRLAQQALLKGQVSKFERDNTVAIKAMEELDQILVDYIREVFSQGHVSNSTKEALDQWYRNIDLLSTQYPDNDILYELKTRYIKTDEAP